MTSNATTPVYYVFCRGEGGAIIHYHRFEIEKMKDPSEAHLKTLVDEYNKENERIESETRYEYIKVEPGSILAYLIDEVDKAKHRGKETLQEAIDAIEAARDAVNSLI